MSDCQHTDTTDLGWIQGHHVLRCKSFPAYVEVVCERSEITDPHLLGLVDIPNPLATS